MLAMSIVLSSITGIRCMLRREGGQPPDEKEKVSSGHKRLWDSPWTRPTWAEELDPPTSFSTNPTLVGEVEPPTADLDLPTSPEKKRLGVGFRPLHLDVCEIVFLHVKSKCQEVKRV